jgi:murein DD-endopeptidase MepM/ murein hydrolase activator NlpD
VSRPEPHLCEYHPGWLHTGEDWYLPEGETGGLEVSAAAAGEVVFAGSEYPGRVVIVQHADDLFSMYGHLDYALAIEPGQAVERGQSLGTILVRTDGRAPSHLHFELRTFFTTPEVNGNAPRYGVGCGFECSPHKLGAAAREHIAWMMSGIVNKAYGLLMLVAHRGSGLSASESEIALRYRPELTTMSLVRVGCIAVLIARGATTATGKSAIVGPAPAKHLGDAATGRDGGLRSFVPAVKNSVFHDSVAPHRGMVTPDDTSGECRSTRGSD